MTTRRGNHAGPARGVTLIETLAALVLLAVVGGVITRAWSISLDLAARSRAVSLAAVLAEERLSEILASGETLLIGDTGDFGEDYENFRWHSRLTEWPEDSRFQQLDLTVTWTRRDRNFETTVSTLIDTAEE